MSSILQLFWAAKLCIEGNGMLLLPGLGLSLVWLGIIGQRFKRKLY
jgi:hypothetical protein